MGLFLKISEKVALIYISQNKTEPFSQNLEPGWNNIQSTLTHSPLPPTCSNISPQQLSRSVAECQESCKEEEELISHRGSFFTSIVLKLYFSAPHFSVFLHSTIFCFTISLLSPSRFNLGQAIFTPSVSLLCNFILCIVFPRNFLYRFLKYFLWICLQSIVICLAAIYPSLITLCSPNFFFFFLFLYKPEF